MARTTLATLGLLGATGLLSATLAFAGSRLETSGSNVVSSASPSGSSPAIAVNRATKVDREALAAETVKSNSLTISFKLPSAPDTSIAMRVPVNSPATSKSTPVAPAADRDSKAQPAKRQPIACEPMMSSLAPAAKQMQPGRCLT